MKAAVSEIFSSFQGEGLFCGWKQIFVRFAGCNLSCDYCDERKKKESESLSAGDILDRVRALRKKSGTGFVSVTGGEPLTQADFLKILLARLKKEDFRILLETNATLYEELLKVRGFADFVSADIKLPSSAGKGLWEKHEKFLRACPAETSIKIVVTGKTPPAEMKRAFELLCRLGRPFPVFIQPVTPARGARRAGRKIMSEIKKTAERHGLKYRVLPQQHPLWGVK